MQISCPGEGGKGLVSRIAADVRAQIHRMPGRLQEPQIGTVGVIHQKQCAVAVAKFGKCRNILQVAEVIGRGDVEREGMFFYKAIFHRAQVQSAGQITVTAREPDGFKIKEGGGG